MWVLEQNSCQTMKVPFTCQLGASIFITMIGWHVPLLKSEMQSSPLASHAVAVGIGAAISVWLRGGPVEPVCPACALSCGSISCPQVVCTTGHIELSSALLLIFIGLIILVCIWNWWFRHWSSDTRSPAKTVVDGRRPALGSSAAYRPAQG